MPESFDPYRKWLGIPEGSRPPTHYQLLAIAPGEKDPDVINAAVVQRSAYVRNFQTGKFADDATRVLNEIAAAKACLLDSRKRAAYDADLKAKQPPPPPRRPASVPPPAPAFDPLAQAAAMSMQAPWASPLGQMPRRKQGVPMWAVASAIGGTVVVVLLIVAVVMSGGSDPQPVAASVPADAAAETTNAPESTPVADAADSTPAETAVAPAVIDSPMPAVNGPSPPAEATDDTESSAAATSAATDSATPDSPAAAEAPPPAMGTSLYLDELDPLELRMLDFDATKVSDSQLAKAEIYGRRPVFLGDAVDKHPLWMHPPREGNESSHVAYELDGTWTRLTGMAAISNVPGIARSATPLVFRVVADGRPLWSSQPLQLRGANQAFELDVTAVRRLELFVDCPGDCNGAYAIWIAPQLDRMMPTTGERSEQSICTVTYQGGGARKYWFDPDGSVEQLPEGIRGKMRREKDDWIIDFGDGKLERLTFAGNRFFIEHWDPAARFTDQPPNTMAVGESPDQISGLKAALTNLGGPKALELPKPQEFFRGVWAVRYATSGTRAYRFVNQVVTETSGTGLKGRVRRDGADWFLDFNDGKIERLSFAGDRILIEHWDPANTFGNKPPSIIAAAARK